jgi:MFS family permease
VKPDPTSAPPLPAAPAGSYKWLVVGMLWMICFFNYADRQSIASVFPRLEEEFGFDKTQTGLIGSAFMWVYAAGAPLAGVIGDRGRRKDLILGGCLFWSLVTIMTGWCSRLWHFVTVRALEGVGETFYFPASMSMVSDYHGRRTRSRAMAFHQSSVYIGTVAGGWLGGWFAEYHGWRMGFYFFGLSGMVLALVLYKFLREPVRGQADTATGAAPAAGPPLSVRETARAIFRVPTALVLMTVFVGANFVATIFLMWTPTFLVQKFDFKLTAAGLSGSVFIHLASALAVPVAGLLADRFSRRMAGGRILVQALGLAAGATFVFLIGTTTTVETLLAAMVAFGLCKGFYDSNIFASMYDVIEPRARASAAGFMNAVGWGGGALGPLTVGWLAMHGRYDAQVEDKAAATAAQMANMSEAIAWCSVIYVVGAVLLLVAAFFLARRDVERQATAFSDFV